MSITSTASPHHPLLVSVGNTQVLLACGRSKIYELIADGKLEAVKLGKSRRVTMQSINGYIDELRSQAAA